jgi:hypothetical protein
MGAPIPCKTVGSRMLYDHHNVTKEERTQVFPQAQQERMKFRVLVRQLHSYEVDWPDSNLCTVSTLGSLIRHFHIHMDFQPVSQLKYTNRTMPYR